MEIRWDAEDGRVRFTARAGIAVAAERRAAVAAVVAKANALSGIEVWRTEPELAVECVADLHDGRLWTRDADRAIRIVETTLARDCDDLARVAEAPAPASRSDPGT
jgi:hypothetical protein